MRIKNTLYILYIGTIVLALCILGVSFAQAADLTNVSNTITNTQTSAVTTHQIDFTTYTDIPADGKIVIIFPAGFNVTSTSFNSWSGFDGSQSITTSSQTVTIIRDGAGATSTAGAKYIKLDSITNTSTINTNYTVIVETQDSASATLDGPTTSFQFSVCANSCHASTYHIPWSSTISASTTHTTKFTTASTTPANGKIKITFPTGFDISSATVTKLSGVGGSFNFTQSTSSQTITITNASTSAMAAGANYAVINGITNQSIASSTYYAILETATTTGANIEGPTSIRFSAISTEFGLSDAPWPIYMHDTRHTGRSSYVGPSYGTVKWVYTAGGSVVDKMILDSSSRIFFQASDGAYSLNSDGSLRWKSTVFANTSPGTGGTAVDQQGNFYVERGNEGFYSFDSNGNLRWKQWLSSGWVQASPAIAPDGTIYFIDWHVYAYDPDGLLKWTAPPLTAPSYAAIAVNSAGVIYIPRNDNKLHSFNPDGTSRWTFNLDSGSYYNYRSSVSIGDDGTLYLGNKSGNLYAYTDNATSASLKWSYSTGGQMYGEAAAIGADGTIYIGGAGQQLHAVNPDGTAEWTYNTGSSVKTPAVDLNNRVYFCSGSKLYALNSTGSLVWSYNGCSAGTGGSPLIDSNGILYMRGSGGNKVYAIQPWTLTALGDKTFVKQGETITFTAVSSMLQQDPVVGETNQVQAYLSNGARVTLSYLSVANGVTTWQGSYRIPDDMLAGDYTATVQAVAVNVETDTAVNFASAPTNSNNTGITTTVNYTVERVVPITSIIPNTYPDSIIINQEAAYTNSREVELSLRADNATEMAICNNLYFSGCPLEPYQTIKTWTLTEGEGAKTVYALFQSSTESQSPIVSDTIVFEQGTASGGATLIEAEDTTEEVSAEVQAELTIEVPIATPVQPATKAELIQQLKVQIVEIQQRITGLLVQLIQLIQQQIVELQSQLPHE